MAFFTLATALGLAATLAGTALQNKEETKAANKRKAAVQQSIRNQQKFRDEKQARLEQSMSEFSGDARKEIVEKRAGDNLDVIKGTVAEGRTDGLSGESGQVAGNFSKTFDDAEADAVQNNIAEGLRRQKGQAKFLAHGGAGLDESILLNKGAQDQSALNTSAQGQRLADNVSIEEAGRVKTSTLGAILKGLGTATSLANFGSGLAGGLSSAGAGSTSAAVDLAGASAGQFPNLNPQIFKPFKLALGPGF